MSSTFSSSSFFSMYSWATIVILFAFSLASSTASYFFSFDSEDGVDVSTFSQFLFSSLPVWEADEFDSPTCSSRQNLASKSSPLLECFLYFSNALEKPPDLRLVVYLTLFSLPSSAIVGSDL